MTIFQSTFSPGKTPIDVLSFGFDFGEAWLAFDPVTNLQDTLVSATITALPNDGSLFIGPVTITNNVIAEATVSGGTAGTTYVLTCIAQTASGMTVQSDEPLTVNASVR